MAFEQQIATVADLLRKSRRICLFTGAGFSCPSGIPDFRSAGGLYQSGAYGGRSPEEILSHTCFMEDTELFYDFYRSHMLYPDAKPNAAHRLFADLACGGREVFCVTQNIDGLHTAAGSKWVAELHGSVHRNRCMLCGRPYPLETVTTCTGVPRCPVDGGIIKPEVVLYGESLPEETVQRAMYALETADCLVIAGTSLSVYPAASMIHAFPSKRIILLNLSRTPQDGAAAVAVYDDVARVAELLRKQLQNELKTEEELI